MNGVKGVSILSRQGRAEGKDASAFEGVRCWRGVMGVKENNKREENRWLPKLGQPRADKADWLALASSEEMLASEPEGTSHVVMSLRWCGRRGVGGRVGMI